MLVKSCKGDMLEKSCKEDMWDGAAPSELQHPLRPVSLAVSLPPWWRTRYFWCATRCQRALQRCEILAMR